MIEVKIGSATSYTASGVDIDAGGKISQLWQEAARQTYNNRDDRFGQLAIEGNRFSDVRGIDLDAIQGKSGLILHGGVDGVGTKPELAERGDNRRTFIDSREERRNHGGIFEDLTAMVADDIARDGGEPVAIWTLFDASELTSIQAEDVAWQLGLGAVEACGKAKIVFSGGETAELGNRVSGYGPFNYNLGGFAIGVSHRSRVLTGEKVLPGDSIVALQEDGFRANGMSLVREVLAAEFGESWHLENEDLARQALQPSKIYTPALVDMHGGYDLDREAQAELSAIVHVTGSGIPGKLQRKLAITGYGAVLEDLFDPPEIMKRVQDWSMKHNSLATPDQSSYQSLNEGNGALIITPEPEAVLRVVAQYEKIQARVAGEIVEKPGIELKSKGITNPDEWIRFISVEA